MFEFPQVHLVNENRYKKLFFFEFYQIMLHMLLSGMFHS